jgi:cold shock protein
MSRIRGTVVWYEVSKGYGFIRPNGWDKDVFVHSRRVSKASLPLLCGDAVEFKVVSTPKGLAAWDVEEIDAFPENLNLVVQTASHSKVSPGRKRH